MKYKRIVVLFSSIVIILALFGISTSAENAADKNNRLFGGKYKIDELSLDKLFNAIADKPVVKDKKVNSINKKKNTVSINYALSKNSVPKKYPKRKGVILVTSDGYDGAIPTGHAAVVYSATQVVEALNSGVAIGKNDWYKSKQGCVAGSLNKTTSAQDAAAANWCKKQLGKPYNFNFYNMDTREKFYCSQLIWAAFMDKYKIDLNMDEFDIFLKGKKAVSAIHPYELLANDKTYIVYKHNWQAN